MKKKIRNLKIYIVPVFPLREGEGVFHWSVFLFRFIRGSIYSFLLTLLFRPCIVVGFGGILSLPLILSASLLRIPTLIHEQNVYPGKANLLLAHFAQKVALSFEDSKHYFKNKSKLIVTGNPLRPDLKVIEREEALRRLGLEPSFFTLLILGGSQGATSINRYFVNLWKNFKQEDLGFQVIHITGLKDWHWVSEKYREINITAKLFSFYEEMEVIYSASDLVIGRAGAATLNEISFFAKPAIIIPYPYAEQHQLHNALYYLKKGGILLLEEKDLAQDKTRDFIYKIIKDREKQGLLSREIKKINNPFATKLLADVVEGILFLN
ncbi:MAG: UDP-N-acetylglucosamine--N-acetylmuramyl-(pentapeptide) pyrophosphoryl-undecaprenol N-acetylglucosamine transferase, partial [Candidatus Omnitrophota bacterium]